MATQMQTHLRTYVNDAIQQKVHLANLLTAYNSQLTKTKERVIDEKELEKSFINQGIDPTKTQWITERRQMDEENFVRVTKIVQDVKQDMKEMTLRLNTHLEELSGIELASGGFVAHAIGVDKLTAYDEKTSTITFEAGGHVEIPIAVRLNQWKDSSQLVIKKIKKK